MNHRGTEYTENLKQQIRKVEDYSQAIVINPLPDDHADFQQKNLCDLCASVVSFKSTGKKKPQPEG